MRCLLLLTGLFLLFLEEPAVAVASTGQLFPGKTTLYSRQYVIEGGTLYWTSSGMQRSRHYVLEAGTASLLDRRKAEVYYVTPSQVIEGLETEVSIVGNYFSDYPSSPSVTVGDRPVEAVRVVSPTLVRFTFPSQISAGLYSVSVIYSGQYRVSITRAIKVVHPPPVVSRIVPSTFYASAGAEFLAYGEHFQQGLTATIDGSPAEVAETTAGRIKVRVPRGMPPGYKRFSVFNPDGQFVTVANALRIIGSPPPNTSAQGCGCTQSDAAPSAGTIPYVLAFLIITVWRCSCGKK